MTGWPPPALLVGVLTSPFLDSESSGLLQEELFFKSILVVDVVAVLEFFLCPLYFVTNLMEMFGAIFFGEIAVFLGFDMGILDQHANDFQIFDLSS